MNIITQLSNKIKRYPKYYKKALQFLTRQYYYNGQSYPTRETIAKFVGCCVTYVSEITRVFEEDRLLVKRGRFNKSVIYNLSPIFDDPSFKTLLKVYIPAMACIGLHVGMLHAAKVSGKSLHYIFKDYSICMSYAKINDIANELRLSNEQRLMMEQHLPHVIEYSMDCLRKKIAQGAKFSTIEARIRYFLKTCNNQTALKRRSYDPYAPIFEEIDHGLAIVTEFPPKSGRGGDKVIIDEILVQSAGELIPLVNYDPVVDNAPQLSPLQGKPETTIEDILMCVSDNYTIDDITVTENGRTTKMVLSDKGLEPKGSVKPKRSSPADVRNVVTYDVEGKAHVTTRDESGWAAIAEQTQLFIKSAPVAEKTTVDESIHQPKHATVADLVGDSMKQHIQTDGAVEVVVGEFFCASDDSWMMDMDQWESIP